MLLSCLSLVLLLLLSIGAAVTSANPHLPAIVQPDAIKQFLEAVHKNDISYVDSLDKHKALPFVPDHLVSGVMISIILGHIEMANLLVRDLGGIVQVCECLRSRSKHIAFVLNEIHHFSSAELDRIAQILSAKYVSAMRYSQHKHPPGRNGQLHELQMLNRELEVMWLSCLKLIRDIRSEDFRHRIINSLSSRKEVPYLDLAVHVTQLAFHHNNCHELEEVFNVPNDYCNRLLQFALINALDQRHLDQAQSLLRNVGVNPKVAFEFAIVNHDFTMLANLLQLGADPNVMTGYPQPVKASMENCDAVRTGLNGGANIKTALPNPHSRTSMQNNDDIDPLVPNAVAEANDVDKLCQLCADSRGDDQVAALMDLIEGSTFQHSICSSIGLASDLDGFRLAATRALCLSSAAQQNNEPVIQQLLRRININVRTRSFFVSFAYQIYKRRDELNVAQRISLTLLRYVISQLENVSIGLQSSANCQKMCLPDVPHLPGDYGNNKAIDAQQKNINADLGLGIWAQRIHDKCAVASTDGLDAILKWLYSHRVQDGVLKELPWKFNGMYALKSAIPPMLCLFSALNAGNAAVIKHVLKDINRSTHSKRIFAVLFHLLSQMRIDTADQKNMQTLRIVVDLLDKSVKVPSVRDRIFVHLRSPSCRLDGTTDEHQQQEKTPSSPPNPSEV